MFRLNFLQFDWTYERVWVTSWRSVKTLASLCNVTELDRVKEDPPTVTQAVAAQIRAYRLRRGWSVRQLAEECAKQGAPQLTQASLENIERGQDPNAKRKPRGVTVDELLVLALALNARPADLLFDGDAARVQVTPRVTVHPFLAWSWLVGMSPHSDAWGTPVQTHEEMAPPRHIHGWLNLDGALMEVDYVHSTLLKEQAGGDAKRIQLAREQYDRKINHLGLFLADLSAADLSAAIPPLPSWLVDDVRRAAEEDRIKMWNGMDGARKHPLTDPDGWLRLRLPQNIPVYECERPTADALA